MSAAPRVLVSGVVLGQPMGGVRRHNVELLPRAGGRLAKRGGQLALLAGRTPLPPALRLARDVRVVASDVPLQPPWLRWAFERRALRRELEHARGAGRAYDLWHTAHLPVPSVGLPYTLTIHDLRDLELDDAPRMRRLLAPHVLARAIDDARAVLTVSDDVKARIEARFSPRRVVVVPNACDHLPVVARAADASTTGALLHVGHVEPRKNLELLLEALALDAALPQLVLAGAAKRGEQARLEQRALELGVRARVTFLGPVEDRELPGLFARAAAVVIPSKVEGFGIGVVEAQRAGVPVAISNTGALSEVAGDGVPTFAPTDARGAAQAIRAALATEPMALARHAERAARFSWDASADLLVAAWLDAVR